MPKVWPQIKTEPKMTEVEEFTLEELGFDSGTDDPLMPTETWPGLPQYFVDKDGAYRPKPISFWLGLADKQSRFNPLVHWKPAYIQFCLKRGGEATKMHINTLLATLGIVGALVAGFLVAGIQQPVECASNGQECHITQDLMYAYGILAGLGIVNCITTVVIVTIASLWIGLYEPHEMAYFLQRFYLASVMFPTTTMSIGAVSSMLMVGVQMYMIFDPIIAYVSYGIAFIFACGIGHVAVRLVFYSTALRKAATYARPYRPSSVNNATVAAVVRALKANVERNQEGKNATVSAGGNK